ncbi:hypothetical protein CXG81DRAFT_20891 [Caulochytrium protostelioides]|uniref:Mediator complex subunit 9 n=1 Tax=Caulochytrium protostelioides TaxID=1555241 RepID=A0A4P9X1E5_9FUNG|nr:hypothetical protein CXG81DRAFT_20891 [Caulochytrium protostelioides]|eukprot:RKO98962.1 hypothetical protein CXG81DRAFT_20891 [Caulochytrium protostelioides]
MPTANSVSASPAHSGPSAPTPYGGMSPGTPSLMSPPSGLRYGFRGSLGTASVSAATPGATPGPDGGSAAGASLAGASGASADAVPPLASLTYEAATILPLLLQAIQQLQRCRSEPDRIRASKAIGQLRERLAATRAAVALLPDGEHTMRAQRQRLADMDRVLEVYRAGEREAEALPLFQTLSRAAPRAPGAATAAAAAAADGAVASAAEPEPAAAAAVSPTAAARPDDVAAAAPSPIPVKSEAVDAHVDADATTGAETDADADAMKTDPGAEDGPEDSTMTAA